MELLNLPYEKYNLNNGLEVILHKETSLPLVSVNIWYKVGSAYEEKGKTGLAHLFEHMMFQGSENVPKEMHFRYIQEAGGTLNGSTNFDRTNYYEKLPSNSLELALWLESDRMGCFLSALTQEKLDNQKSVVANERLERYDNQPYGLAWELVLENLYPEGHPYSWATIGYLDNIKNYTLADVQDFFRMHYTPDNATLVIAGDIELNKTKDLVDKYFGSIIPSLQKKEPAITDIRINKNIVVEHPDNVQLDRLYLAWHTDKIYSTDDPALDVLADILSGSKNSRLYKKLVFDEEISQDVSAFQFSGKFGGMFMIISTAKPGIALDRLKQIIFDEIGTIIKRGVEEKELIKTKNSIKAGYIYSMQSLDNIADRLNMYNFYLNEPNKFNFDLIRYNKITNKDVSDVCRKYLLNPFVELRVISNKKNS
ncbi:MAG TPA: pitrilysin family protein [Ignavibacteriaceae bacterium]|nr:pitrilysin family protein [Ignavibacteriaceae bacterium]